MFDLIEKLREKPESSKKKIAFLTSFTLAGLIFVVWLSVIYPDFSFSEKQRQTANANDTGMFSSFITNMKDGISGIKSQIDSVKETISSIATSTHYTVDNNEASTTDAFVETTQYSTTTQDFNPNL